MVELLAPAGSGDALRAAVNAGADAVYIGGSMFGARAYAQNPGEDALLTGIDYCHLHGKKIYMTVNTLLKEAELEETLYPFLLPYYRQGMDGLIVQDLGVAAFVKEYFPGLDVHASTQMTVTGAFGAAFLQKEGITRVVPARELSLEEIRTIIQETGIEVETFIHGAMCYCYSGQCLMSSMIGGRSGNRGRCAQPCRLPYSLADTSGRKLRDASGLLSMKDMCTVDILPELIDAGIASLKIEGRMKRPEYTAGVVEIYRKYIDCYMEKGKSEYSVSPEDRAVLMDLYNRGGFSKGYYFQYNGRKMMTMDRPNHLGTEAAKVIRKDRKKIKLTALEPLYKKDILEILPGKDYTLKEDIPRGTVFELPEVRTALAEGSVIHRTRNEHLLRELQEKYLSQNIKEKIKGELRIFRDFPAILILNYCDIEIRVSAVIAQKAENTPTTEETIRRQMQKTGNTPFVFENLQIKMEDQLFVSIRDLNELRRNGLQQLEERILEEAKRQTGSAPARPLVSAVQPAERYKFTVSVIDYDQLDTVLSQNTIIPDTIYLDSLMLDQPERLRESIRRMKERKIKCFLNFPPVFRRKEQSLMKSAAVQSIWPLTDGVLIHTVDELAFARRMQDKTGMKLLLAADYSLYAYNRRAAAFWEDRGVVRRTLPLELNFREMQHLGGMGTELEVYGYQPLMHSAQCVTANTTGCTGKTAVKFLTDRKNASFPVINRCNICCNTIYNSVPLQLADCREEIAGIAPEYLRLSFTVESAGQTQQVLNRYAQFQSRNRADHESIPGSTRGHFRRGVE